MDKCEYDLKNYRDWEECYWPRQIAPSKISITLHTLWKPNFQTWPMLAGSEDLGFEPTKTWRIFWMNYNNTCKLATTEPYGVKKKKTWQSPVWTLLLPLSLSFFHVQQGSRKLHLQNTTYRPCKGKFRQATWS